MRLYRLIVLTRVIDPSVSIESILASSLQKSVPIAGKSLSLRADFLNLFDNPLFSGPIGTFGTSNFGQIATVNGLARSVQFQARFAW